MLKGIIFDMDGVLIDSHPVHRAAWRRFLATLGKSVTDDDLEFILEGRRREDILRHFLGELQESQIAAYGRQKGLFFEENFGDVKVVPGVREFLQNVSETGVQAAVATSASSTRTWGTLNRLGLKGKFATVVTGDDVEAGKPDPEVYRLTAQRLNLPLEGLLVLEDAPCGVRAARAAGMRCIGISANGHAEMLRACGAEFVIPDFVDLSVEKLRQRANM